MQSPTWPHCFCDLQDDVLGDPDVGMDMHEALADALDAEAEGGSGDGSDSDAQPSDSDADILSEGSDEVELIPDAELDALDVFSLPAPSDVDSDVTGEDGHEEDGTGVESDGHGGESSSFDEETFAKAMVGHSSADDDAAVATEVELGATKSKMDKKGRKGKRKGKSTDVFADYEEYAHLLDNVDAGKTTGPHYTFSPLQDTFHSTACPDMPDPVCKLEITTSVSNV